MKIFRPRPSRSVRPAPALACLFLLSLAAACLGAKSMLVTCSLAPAAPLKNYTVYLTVNDRRAIQTLVGAAAGEKGLFPELRADRFDLKVVIPDGSEVTMTNLPTATAVREAVSRRLAARNVVVTAQRSAAQLTVEVNIRALNIDLAGGDLMATADLAAKVYRDPGNFTASEIHVASNRMKLIGGVGGAAVLSDALTQAVNDLDFSAINNY